MADENKILLPSDFKTILIECLDPSQSTDYFDLGSRIFPVQVLPIGLEKKIIRLANRYRTDDEYDRLLVLATSELCHFYDNSVNYGWTSEIAKREELENFYLKHLEKLSYNEDVISVVDQVIEQIDWKPNDDRKLDEMRRYLPAHIFLPVLSYIQSIDGMNIIDVWSKITRGLLAIVRLGNMITNDKMKQDERQRAYSSGINQQMNDAKTAEDYLTGLASQGFDMKDFL